MSSAPPFDRAKPAPAPVVPLVRPDRRLGTELPMPLTPLVGREREVADVIALVRRADVRLLTLTGPGGVGKTRLALQATADLEGEVADGAAFAPLAAVRDPGLVLPTIAQALGVRESGGRTVEEVVEAFLRERHLLLVLDNFEQVLDAAPVVARLLAASPTLKVLATSRAPLRVYGERDYLVPPLALPDLRRPPPFAALAANEAVRLFAERAGAARADFALTPDNAPAVAAVCARLDGLPLAIELAAARAKLLSPQALLARLDDRLTLLTGGARDQPERLRTMRDAIAWSHDLLTDEERVLFRRLAVFAGGFTLEAAAAVALGEHPAAGLRGQVLEGISSLLDKSLLRQETRPDDEPRVLMLETIRDYGLERLDAAGEGAEMRRRHALYFLGLAEETDRHLDGPDEPVWLERLEAEHDNLRAALAWLLEQPAESEAGLRLAGALGEFWMVHAHLDEGRRWLERALAVSRDVPSAARANALVQAADLARMQGDDEQAGELAAAGLALYRELGDKPGIARALLEVGAQAATAGDVERAVALCEEGLALAREEDSPLAGSHLIVLGEAARGRGDDDRAVACYAEALALARARGQTSIMAYALNNLGLVATRQGRDDRAAALFAEALGLWQALGERWAMTETLEGLAVIAGKRGQAERAARVLGAVEELNETLGAPWSPAEPAQFERAMVSVRATLGEAGFAAAWAAGRALPLEQTIAEAAAVAATAMGPGPAPTGDPTARRGLTRRELEVLRLIAEGRTNREIAETLAISRRTVTTHTTGIFTKLEVGSRTAAIATARRLGLL